MNSLIENKIVTEMECGNNFAYILEDSKLFQSTEYKVLQSQINGCFVKCMKMLFNGKIQFYYLTKGYKSLASILPVLDPENFITIAANLISDVIDVKNNGFLSCQNIDASFNHIYVDTATYKVRLVYLPTYINPSRDFSIFETELRTGLVKLISLTSNLSSSKTIKFASDLSNGSLSLEALYSRIKGGAAAHTNPPDFMPPPSPPNSDGVLRIIAVNAPIRVVLEVTKDEFVIGKKEEIVDGVISFNKMISRQHCKINRNGSQYTITDLQSSNGTYVNQVRLQPNHPYVIKNGDILRLADSDFQVSIA